MQDARPEFATPMTTRQMRLGLSVANLGYHYAAWRLPEISDSTPIMILAITSAARKSPSAG